MHTFETNCIKIENKTKERKRRQCRVCLNSNEKQVVGHAGRVNLGVVGE